MIRKPGPGIAAHKTVHSVDMTPQHPMTDQEGTPLLRVLDRAETCSEPLRRDRVDAVPGPSHVLPIPAHYSLPAAAYKPASSTAFGSGTVDRAAARDLEIGSVGVASVQAVAGD